MKGLNSAHLKLIALIAMTVDHMGLMMFDNSTICRIIGRPAFPVFAYMIAEGCSYTHNMCKYFLRLFALGLICQAGYFFVYKTPYLCILLTFSASVGLICALKYNKLLFALGVALTACVNFILPLYLKGFAMDYGFFGVMLPVLIYMGKTKTQKLVLTALDLIVLSISMGLVQWWCLTVIIPLCLYNGKRGNKALGKVFYLYYPIHFVVIYGLSLLIN